MKLRLLLVGLVAVVLTASSALAAPPADKGMKPTTGEGCKPRVTVVLKGIFKEAPLKVDVTSGNRWGRGYVEGTANTTITVNDDTKVRRQGQKKITDLVVGDRVLVQAKVCKADFKTNPTPALTASKVIAHPAKAEKNDAENDD
jgi:hypothetical protein